MGRTVTSVVVIGGDAGTSSRARLALTGDGVPASVFVKMPAETTATRLLGELGRLADTETRFYSQLAPELTGLPKAYGSAFDPLTGRFVLVLEDLAADNCEFPDTLHPLDRGQAGAIVELLARLHATFWGRPPGWLHTASADSASLLTGPLLKTSARRIAERTDIPVEDGRFIDDNYRKAAEAQKKDADAAVDARVTELKAAGKPVTYNGSEAIQVGDYARAIAEFRTSYEEDGQSLTLIFLARVYAETGQLSMAIDLYRGYLEQVPIGKRTFSVEGEITRLSKLLLNQRIRIFDESDVAAFPELPTVD